MLSKSAELQEQIHNLDVAIQQAGNLSERNQLEAERNELNNQLQAALAEEEKKEREQEKAEQIGGLKETIRSIFEASFPKEETVKIMGLTEYEETQQTFNQLIDQAVDEDQLALYALFQMQLEQRDEKIKTLTLQALDVEKQLEVESEISRRLEVQNDKMAVSLDNKDEEITALKEQIGEGEERSFRESAAVSEEIERLNNHIFDLQKQIANFQLPQQIIDIIPTHPSESLTERIAKAKVNSKLQLANVKPIGANWVEGINSEGNKEVAHVNDVEQVNEFESIKPLNNVLGEAEPTAEVTFQENSEVQTNDDPRVQSDVRNTTQDTLVGQAEETTVTRAEFEALAARVVRIEIQANLPLAG